MLEHTARQRFGLYQPIRGTASLVLGIMFCTMFINTVRERRIVTPADIQPEGHTRILGLAQLIGFINLNPWLWYNSRVCIVFVLL